MNLLNTNWMSLADIHSLDLIVYNLEGDLLLNATKDANQPKIFTQQFRGERY